MKVAISVNDGEPVTAHLNEDVKIEFGGGDFALTATYPTYPIEEIVERTARGERVSPVEGSC